MRARTYALFAYDVWHLTAIEIDSTRNAYFAHDMRDLTTIDSTRNAHSAYDISPALTFVLRPIHDVSLLLSYFV